MHNSFVQFAKLLNKTNKPTNIWAQCTKKHVLSGQIVNTQQPKKLAWNGWELCKCMLFLTAQ